MAQSNTPYQNWLAAYREKLQNDLTRLRGLETRWSWIRLIAFVAGVVAAILLRRHLPLAAGAGIAGFLAFAGAVLRHTNWQSQRAFVERTLIVAAESLHASTRRDCPARAWHRPEDPPQTPVVLPRVTDSGPTWSLTDQERDDLDLYGPPVGLFGLLNRTSTPPGERRLRDILDSPCLSPEHIRERQQAVGWLQAHHEQRFGMMAALASLRSHARQIERLIPLLYQAKEPSKSILPRGIRPWSVISGMIFVFAVPQVAVGQYAWLRILVPLLLLNNIILVFARRRLRRLGITVQSWTSLRSTLESLLAVAEHAGRDLPEETQLSLLRTHFHTMAVDAQVPSLCRRLEWAGLHGLIRAVLNVVVFFDLHIAKAVFARIGPHRDKLLHGLSAMAELEALCSLGCFGAELPTACYPQPDADSSLSIEDGRHPLILESSVVPNSIHLVPDARTWVITGPNAAGKSTFLRMVGVNVLLAQIGAPVAARRMTWSPVRLITDVRIRDDLAHNESYFLSEVRRLRRLVLDTSSNAPMLGLIDEPFRGTNSQERAAAGVALLEHLMASSNLFLIATHEELLARTAAGSPSARNFHFQEHLQDGGIAFDYLLRPGPAGTKTALRILEQEGYPKALLERARGLMPPAG